MTDSISVWMMAKNWTSSPPFQQSVFCIISPTLFLFPHRLCLWNAPWNTPTVFRRLKLEGNTFHSVSTARPSQLSLLPACGQVFRLPYRIVMALNKRGHRFVISIRVQCIRILVVTITLIRNVFCVWYRREWAALMWVPSQFRRHLVAGASRNLY